MSDEHPRTWAALPHGGLEYVDTGGNGQPLVLLHGALMDEQLWGEVMRQLPSQVRCIVPILPVGAHRRSRPAGAGNSPQDIAVLVGELVDHLDLQGAVLVGNDTGGAIAQLLVSVRPSIAAGLVLVSCDAFDNFPPGLPGRTMALAARVPGGLFSAMAALRWRPLRRLPFTYGWMARRPIPDEMFERWLTAYFADVHVRRDVKAMMAGVDRQQLVQAADRLGSFSAPALVVWAADDRVMPRDHADRLVGALPDARLVLVEDSYTLIPLDQPGALAELLITFVTDDLPTRQES